MPILTNTQMWDQDLTKIEAWRPLFWLIWS